MKRPSWFLIYLVLLILLVASTKPAQHVEHFVVSSCGL